LAIWLGQVQDDHSRQDNDAAFFLNRFSK